MAWPAIFAHDGEDDLGGGAMTNVAVYVGVASIVAP